eukprot:1849166-Rhodomonas_salina.3
MVSVAEEERCGRRGRAGRKREKRWTGWRARVGGQQEQKSFGVRSCLDLSAYGGRPEASKGNTEQRIAQRNDRGGRERLGIANEDGASGMERQCCLGHPHRHRHDHCIDDDHHQQQQHNQHSWHEHEHEHEHQHHQQHHQQHWHHPQHQIRHQTQHQRQHHDQTQRQPLSDRTLDQTVPPSMHALRRSCLSSWIMVDHVTINHDGFASVLSRPAGALNWALRHGASRAPRRPEPATVDTISCTRTPPTTLLHSTLRMQKRRIV